MKDPQYLRNEHKALLVMGEKVLKNLDIHNPSKKECARIFIMGTSLCKTGLLHVVNEDALFYKVLHREAEGEIREAVVQLWEKSGDLDPVMEAFKKRWTERGVRDDFAGYKADVSALIQRLQQRIHDEEAVFVKLDEKG